VRQRRLVHLVHQFLNLVRAHRYADKHAHFQYGTDKQQSQPLHQRHDTLACGRAAAQGFPPDDEIELREHYLDGRCAKKNEREKRNGLVVTP
jgi:hypothetical protein